MEEGKLIAKAAILIDAALNEVWDILVDPVKAKEYMFGTTVISDWKKGSEITWKGEWKGKPYEDKGKILDIQPNKRLQYSHYSPLSGEEDKPGNYHTVTIDLTPQDRQTRVALVQDNNKTKKGQEESAENWENMLKSIKAIAEKSNG